MQWPKGWAAATLLFFKNHYMSYWSLRYKYNRYISFIVHFRKNSIIICIHKILSNYTQKPVISHKILINPSWFCQLQDKKLSTFVKFCKVLSTFVNHLSTICQLKNHPKCLAINDLCETGWHFYTFFDFWKNLLWKIIFLLSTCQLVDKLVTTRH